MTELTYVCTVRGDERLRFRADLAQAAAPVFILDQFDEWDSTPFQTADGRHSAYELAQVLNDWLGSEGGRAWGNNESVSVDELREKPVRYFDTKEAAEAFIAGIEYVNDSSITRTTLTRYAGLWKVEIEDSDDD